MFSCLNVGVVASPTDRLVPSANRNGNMEDELPEEPVKILESQAVFDNFVVWGHEIPPAADDTFVKGVDEWIKLAEAV
jgi:ribonuclease H2 subunit C